MRKPVRVTAGLDERFGSVLGDISTIVDEARRTAARSVNRVMTAAYWLIGRRIVEFEQEGETRAEYGEQLIERLAADLSAYYGRGFSIRNVWQMKAFYLAWPIPQTPSAQSQANRILQTPSAESSLSDIASKFSLPWSAYIRLLSVRNEEARRFYETEALRGGWSVRQLDRQINSQFYERTVVSRDKVAMLSKQAATSVSSASRSVCASVTNGIGWISSFSTVACDVWWSSTSRLASSPTPTRARCIFTSTTRGNTGFAMGRTRRWASSSAPERTRRLPAMRSMDYPTRWSPPNTRQPDPQASS